MLGIKFSLYWNIIKDKKKYIFYNWCWYVVKNLDLVVKGVFDV